MSRARGIHPVPEGLDEGLNNILKDLRRLAVEVQAGRIGLTGVVGGSGGGGIGGLPGTGGGSGSAIDLTPPPTPTGLTVSAGIFHLIIETDPELYTQGHGHGRTLVYGATYSGTGPLPVFADAVLITSAAAQPISYATDPNTTWHIWVRWRSRDGVESPPAGGVNGVSATTGQDVTHLLEILTGQITESQLHADLGDMIDLIVNSEPGSVDARIAALQTLLENADLSLANQITLITAGTADQFDSKHIWYFDSGVESWSGNGTPTASASFLKPAAHASDPYVESPGSLALDGTAYPQVRLRIRQTGTPTWEGYLWWRAPADTTWDASRRMSFSEPTYDGNGLAVVTINATWGAITVDKIRIDLSSASDGVDYFELDWVATGRAAPGASIAALQTEATARSDGDSANASLITTLQSEVDDNLAALEVEASTRATQTGELYAQYTVKVDLNGYVAGYGLASTATTGTPTSAFAVRADQFYVASPTGPGITPIVPFVVQTTPTTVNGVAVPVGVYMDAAFIKNGTITAAKIGNAVIDDAKIANVTATKLTAGTIGVGVEIQSTGYVSGTNGWKITGAGFAEFNNNVVVRGTIFAGAGLIGGNTITATEVKSPGYTPGPTGAGWRLGSDGHAEVQAADVRGLLTANQIDTRGLTVKDASGNVILGSGNALADEFMGGFGNNVIFNADFATGTTAGWAAGGGNTGQPVHWGINLGNDPNWSLRGEGALFNHLPGYTLQPGQYADVYGNGYPGQVRYPCIAGRRYEFSAYLDPHRCQGYVALAFYNASGAYITEFNSSFVTVGGTPFGGSVAGMGGRALGFCTAPSGAVTMLPIVRMWGNGGNDPYLFAARIYLGEAGLYQTQPSRWFPGMGIRQITGATVSTFIESVAIGSAQIGFAAINNAHINNAAVNTLQLAGDAVTVPIASYPDWVFTQWAEFAGGNRQTIHHLGGITTSPQGQGRVLMWFSARQAVAGNNHYVAKARCVAAGSNNFSRIRIIRNLFGGPYAEIYDDANNAADASERTNPSTTLIDYPGAGVACNYYLVLDTSSAGGAIHLHEINRTTCVLMECKR